APQGIRPHEALNGQANLFVGLRSRAPRAPSIGTFRRPLTPPSGLAYDPGGGRSSVSEPFIGQTAFSVTRWRDPGRYPARAVPSPPEQNTVIPGTSAERRFHVQGVAAAMIERPTQRRLSPSAG